MITFKKQKDPDNKFDTTTVIVESSAVTLPDVLSDFKEFLMACGFQISPSSELIFYEEEEE